jgi:hypothetical protein
MAAVPGTSNHGWGKAVDWREGSAPMTFDSPGYAWLVANAGIFGWIHPKGMKQGGPVPEPWHWEWIGDGGKLFPGQYFGLYNTLPMSGSPIGNLEAVWPVAGGFRVLGWALDPDQVSPIDVHVYIGPWWGGSHVANTPRPDVGAAYPSYSSQPHGIDVTVPADPGVWEVCVYPIDKVAPGTNVLLGCRTVTVPPPAGTAAISVPDPTTTPTTSPTTSAVAAPA